MHNLEPGMLNRGYILGGLMWFAVPFTLATTLGLTGLALDLPLSAKEVSSELVLPKPLLISGATATQQLPRDRPASNILQLARAAPGLRGSGVGECSDWGF